MDYIFEGLKNALKMIVGLDRQVISIALISIKVSITSIILATLLGVPVGF